jgi:hypothetical protein
MTSMRALFLFLCLSLLPKLAVAVPQPRPFTGNGVLFIRPFISERAAVPPSLVFYREPGVERVAERPVAAIPSLAAILGLAGDGWMVAVMGTKGNWLRIAYDEAGREGWVEMARWWEYQPWEAFLPGRVAGLLPGLKKGEYTLHASPAEGASQLPPLAGRESLQLLEIRDDWALVAASPGQRGWLRWRDGDGRVQITVGEKFDQQKR